MAGCASFECEMELGGHVLALGGSPVEVRVVDGPVGEHGAPGEQFNTLYESSHMGIFVSFIVKMFVNIRKCIELSPRCPSGSRWSG